MILVLELFKNVNGCSKLTNKKLLTLFVCEELFSCLMLPVLGRMIVIIKTVVSCCDVDTERAGGDT